jgi:hypothetical protein
MVVNFGTPLPIDSSHLYALCSAEYSTTDTLDALFDLQIFDMHPLIVGNENTSADTLAKILDAAIEQNSARSLLKIASHKNTSGETLHKLLKMIEPGDKRAIEQIAENLNISKDTAIIIAQHKETYIRCCLARNPSTPGYIVDRMASPKYLNQIKNQSVDYMLATIASAPNASTELLHRLLNPKEFHSGLNDDEQKNILLCLSKNPAISSETMNILAANDDLQGEVIMNPAITTEALEKINYDTTASILVYNVRYFGKATGNVLRKIVRSTVPEISDQGCSTPNSTVEDIYYAANVRGHSYAKKVLCELQTDEFAEFAKMVSEDYSIDINGYSQDMIHAVLNW